MSEVQQISAGNEPFTTTDEELALSLLTAGCQFAEIADGGPAQQHFTPDVCRDRWVTQRDAITGERIRVQLLPSRPSTPDQFERAVMRAEKMKIKGITTYYIARDSVFREAMTAHDRMVKIVTDAMRDGVEPTVPNLSAMTEAAMIMTVCYIRRRNKSLMDSYVWIRPPNLAMGDVKKTVNQRSGVPGEILEQMNYSVGGSGKIWSLNLPDEKRATIMPDGKPFIHLKPKL